MTTDALFEAMARAIIGAFGPACRDECGPDYVAGCGCAGNAATAALRAITEAGCAVVPVEATMNQLAAGQSAWLSDPARRSSTLYRAMVATGRVDGGA